MGAFEKILSTVKGLTPKQKEDLTEAEKSDLQEEKKSARQRMLKRTEAYRNKASRPVAQNVTVALGGAAAEVVRRKLVGRMTDNVLAQAVGVAGVGGLAQLADGFFGTGFLKNFGLGHMGAAGFIAAAKGFDKEGAPDPLVVAYQGTTEKYIKDKNKKKKKDDDKDDDE
ncbi:hypothetical protein [Haliangium sp. UPWRP_2]|uniref:hypothetical protein n=1 Tax=Haliangium sp. UPWRP_2 TaxID=1931276 RepID=UPI0011B249DF|nr:hypothetical protein [Haliangium sp. UPWRP_2]